ncbi:hypothetical protein FRC20_006903 [Serendipita sp. 405]|nr:hypothetical protein FRC15_006431 [Serendipita sp. 397]KAG8775684.1 hypothetical protein FRC16_004754 [Serendipita sp. 398]KAG8836906.1 hypothetical protein FRC20_006903 [Serendipita sp. 405]
MNVQKASAIKVEHIPISDKVVLVIGPTGSGKSTFINYAIGGDGTGIGVGLKPSTTGIILTSVCFKRNQPETTTVGGSATESTIWFVDTPGLDVSSEIDTESFCAISEFLTPARKRGLQLEILYLYRINDIRMVGPPLKHLQFLATLCPDITMPKTVLVTTMWSLLPNKITGENREKELKAIFAKSVTHTGCGFLGFGDSYESVYEIVFSDQKADQGDIVRSRKQLVVERRELIPAAPTAGSSTPRTSTPDISNRPPNERRKKDKKKDKKEGSSCVVM